MSVDGQTVYRVLALDDEPGMLTLYRDILCVEAEEASVLEALFSRPGETPDAGQDRPRFEVTLCSRAEEAVARAGEAQAEGRPFAVALMDVRLAEGPDGVWAAERLRGMDQNVEIVMVTAYADVTLRELNLRIPPPEKLLFLHKPFRAQELRQLAISLCSKWHTENKLRELNETLLQRVEERTRELNGANEQLRRDIAERAEVMARLRMSEERYRVLFEEDITGNFVAGPDGAILDCNESFAHLFGYASAREARGFDFSSLEFERGDAASLLDLACSGRRLRNLELVYRGRGREPVFLIGSFDGVLGSDGELREIRGYFYDITERRALENQLRLAQKMEALGTLAGGIAHDFNNILGVMMGYAEIVLSRAGNDPGLERRVGEILSAGSRARDLVDQILNFSRQGPQERQSLKLGPLIKEALKLLRSSLPANVAIRTDLRAREDLVLADPTQVHQILLNLCANAAHAMRQGGGILTVALADADEPGGPVPAEGLGDARFFLRLSVSDTGHGMPPEVQERIFDPFFTTKKPGEGTGMGLAVVHGIVKRHDGAVSVTSEPGQGTAFHVFLPRAATLERPEAAEEPVLLPVKGRVLFVDDEKPLVDIGREMLEGFGFEVVARTSSVEALEAFRYRPDDFDLVLSDQTMPNMTGVELAREILRIRPDIPIVLCTGFSEGLSYEHLRSLGIADCIMKPMLKRQLVECVSRLLSRGGEKSGSGGKRRGGINVRGRRAPRST
ncbi:MULTISPECIES: response regulator [Desulfovibrio]|uniref:ATP-binding response regulator n=1 Tax=Desulfovibrio TaxID=872 RepID=UPI00040284A5|nr:response regulator [Desulfovibrio sp.]